MKEQEDTYYISGPMTGLPNFNYDAFAEAASTLRSLGFSVVSPTEGFDHETEEERAGRTWGWYMAKAIAKMSLCNCIVLLPGWSKSRGARKELGLALANEMRVYYYLGPKLGKQAYMEIL